MCRDAMSTPMGMGAVDARARAALPLNHCACPASPSSANLLTGIAGFLSLNALPSTDFDVQRRARRSRGRRNRLRGDDTIEDALHEKATLVGMDVHSPLNFNLRLDGVAREERRRATAFSDLGKLVGIVTSWDVAFRDPLAP